MQKILFLTQVFILSLYAKDATSQELNSIYQEAVLFVLVFGTMGLISYVYSKKHAKEYKPKEKIVEIVEVDRLSELSKMLDSKLLTQDEFDILTQHYENKS